MKKISVVASSFCIMLCLGSVYAWSIFVPELIASYGFSVLETQLVFGTVIAVFAVTMIGAGRLESRYGPQLLAVISAVLFCGGYLLSGFSGGSFPLVLLGTGVIAGIGTGFGYLAALTTPVKWYPHKKGLITGIAAAGFGLAAVLMSAIAENMMASGINVLSIFRITGILYGCIILLCALLIKNPPAVTSSIEIEAGSFHTQARFYQLVSGIFCGTFAGLLVIGSLGPIGASSGLESHILMVGISLFAIANFSGRIMWGLISDYTGAKPSIAAALTCQALAILFIGTISLTPAVYLILAIIIGFGFGGNFVLFARETAQLYGTNRLGSIYPYVFLGYAAAGILGPFTGGFIKDIFGSFTWATIIAALISLVGALLFLPLPAKRAVADITE